MNGGSAADTGGTAGSGGETKGCAAVVVDLEATGGRRQGRHGTEPPPFHLAA